MNGRVIAGRYNLQSPIGRGAMGVVWRARDQLLDREVAIKEVVISALISADERRTAYQRTLREARTAARLSHRGVVTVYDVAEEDGRPWIVMELIPSQSLDQVLTVQGRLPVARVCAIGQQLLSALAAAHTAGVLHRDVKPSNVLIANSKVGDTWEERAVLTDFGIAQFEGDPRLTQTGMVMGSPGFTAPERIRGGDATSASDLWSLGATIYAAVEGRGPYEARGGAITTMSAIINEDAPVAPHAAQLAPLIAALLRRDPSTRPSAASAARLFAQVLPQLTDAPAESPAPAHPPTVLSEQVQAAAAPAASAPVTIHVDDPADAEPAPAAADAAASVADEQVADQQAVGKQAAARGKKAAEAGQPAKAARDSAVDVVAAARAAADSAGGAEPAAVAEPEAAPASESGPEAGSEPAAGVAPSTVETPVLTEAKAQAKAAEAVPPDAPAVDSQTSGTPTTFADPPEAEAASAGGETPVADKDSGYQPTEFAIPVARVTPPTPTPKRPPEQKPAEPRPPVQRPAQPKPVQPKPTFTAAKPMERPTPSYSAASPARPQPPAPTPERRPAPGGSSGTGQGHPGGAAAPFTPGGGQYAGPSQSYPDLARQYAPGTGGGRTGRGRSRGKQIAWLAVAVIIAAAIGVGAALALNHHNGGGSPNAVGSTGTGFVQDTPTGFKSVDALNALSAVLPSGWSHVTVTAADLGAPAVAGFSIDLPPGWSEKRAGLVTNFSGPGDMLVTVDLTAQSTTDMLTAATNVERESVAEGKFPGYKRINLQEVPVRNTKGAVWKFSWTQAGDPPFVADDIFFAKAMSAGLQDYAIYIRSPQSTFSGTALPLFDQILPTFLTVPAS
jgi:tRNA A-37 threonylcarbamoyl transferase component Bud32